MSDTGPWTCVCVCSRRHPDVMCCEAQTTRVCVVEPPLDGIGLPFPFAERTSPAMVPICLPCQEAFTHRTAARR